MWKLTEYTIEIVEIQELATHSDNDSQAVHAHIYIYYTIIYHMLFLKQLINFYTVYAI